MKIVKRSQQGLSLWLKTAVMASVLMIGLLEGDWGFDWDAGGGRGMLEREGGKELNFHLVLKGSVRFFLVLFWGCS